MATIPILVQRSQLYKIDPQLEPHVQEQAYVYALPRAKDQFRDRLPRIVSKWKPKVLAGQQVDELLYAFCSGEDLAHDTQRGNGGDFHYLESAVDGVWEFKTGDVRIFGWFYKRDVFIISDLDDADKIKRLNLYGPYAEQLQRDREALDLDDPKFLTSRNPYDVVTNYYDS